MQKLTIPEKSNIKYTIKDSVFSDLFKQKHYLMQLYQTLHPEDLTTTPDDLTDITINNILTDQIHNDLGFLSGETFLILIEAQSLWTVNIIIRAFLYLAQTYHDYFQRTGQNLYQSRRVHMPKPELYVIYTGSRKQVPDTISLSEEFFNHADTSVDIKVRVLCENESDSIINQYIRFSKIYNEQRTLYGRCRKTVTEAIRICKEQNILKEYLENQEKEVVSIMMRLFDEEEILKSYIRCERQEAAQEAAKEAQIKAAKEKAKLMLANGKISLDEMQTYFPELSQEERQEIEAEVLQQH